MLMDTFNITANMGMSTDTAENENHHEDFYHSLLNLL